MQEGMRDLTGRQVYLPFGGPMVLLSSCGPLYPGGSVVERAWGPSKD